MSDLGDPRRCQRVTEELEQRNAEERVGENLKNKIAKLVVVVGGER